MRTLAIGTLTAALLSATTTARAADLDYDVLRGGDFEPAPVEVVDWSGFYVGAHGGYTAGALSQRNVFQSTLADYFRRRDIESELSVSNALSLPGSRLSGGSFGAFAGYNLQIDEVVVGIEADYTHLDRAASVTGGIARYAITTGGLFEAYALDGRSTTRVEDYGTIRARAGYAIGSFLPFVTGGLAVGQVRIDDTVSAQNYGYDQKAYTANQANPTGTQTYVYNHGYKQFNQRYPNVGSSPAGEIQTVPAGATSLTAAARSKTVGGLALGAGVEYAVTPNLLLRGEYQYILFQDFNGHTAELNTVRGGAALKF